MIDYTRVEIWTNQDGEPVFKLPDGTRYEGPLFAYTPGAADHQDAK